MTYDWSQHGYTEQRRQDEERQRQEQARRQQEEEFRRQTTELQKRLAEEAQRRDEQWDREHKRLNEYLASESKRRAEAESYSSYSGSYTSSTSGSEGCEIAAVLILAVFLVALFWVLSCAALLFGLGYTAMADIKSGTAALAWSRIPVTRAFPLLPVIAATYMLVIRHHFSTKTAGWCATIMIALIIVMGPERVVVLGYLGFLPLFLCRTRNGNDALEILLSFCFFGPLVVALGALAAYCLPLAGLSNAHLLRDSLGTFIMPMKHHMGRSGLLLELFPLAVNNVFMSVMLLVGAGAEEKLSFKLRHKAWFGILPYLILMTGIIGGYKDLLPLDAVFSVLFGLLRVFNVCLAVYLLQHGKTIIPLYHSGILRFGIILMIMVEVLFACNLLGLA